MSMNQQRKDHGDRVFKTLQTCIRALAPLNTTARMRVLNGIRVWINEGAPRPGTPETGETHEPI